MTRIHLLKYALRTLWRPVNEQLDYLEHLGIHGFVDEIALEYDAISQAAEDMLLRDELNQAQYDAVRNLDSLLSAISGDQHSNLWSTEALRRAPEWENVRRLAKKTLDLLDPLPGGE